MRIARQVVIAVHRLPLDGLSYLRKGAMSGTPRRSCATIRLLSPARCANRYRKAAEIERPGVPGHFAVTASSFLNISPISGFAMNDFHTSPLR
jgi:hypothetical protein